MNGLCMLHLTQFPAQAPAPRAAQANASAQLSSIPWRVRAETLEKWETSHLKQNPQEGLYLETEFVKRQIPEWQLREEEGGAGLRATSTPQLPSKGGSAGSQL